MDSLNFYFELVLPSEHLFYWRHKPNLFTRLFVQPTITTNHYLKSVSNFSFQLVLKLGHWSFLLGWGLLAFFFHRRKIWLVTPDAWIRGNGSRWFLRIGRFFERSRMTGNGAKNNWFFGDQRNGVITLASDLSSEKLLNCFLGQLGSRFRLRVIGNVDNSAGWSGIILMLIL